MNKTIEELIHISRYAGERFDLVQAGGGNSSVKPGNGRMLVKASGFSMADMSNDSGFVDVDLKLIVKEIESIEPAVDMESRVKVDRAAEEFLKRVCASPVLRPSIETFMHAAVGKFVLHVHPLAVNAAVCSENWDDVARKLFPGAIFVDVLTAGISLGAFIKRKIDSENIDARNPLYIFLRNHGLIISAETGKDVIAVTEQVVLEMERHMEFDFSRYRSVSDISLYMRNVGVRNKITHLVCDEFICEAARKNVAAFHVPPFCPDMMVFNGEAPLVVESLDDGEAIASYLKKYDSPPTVILHGGNVYISAPNLSRAREFESVLKAHLEIVLKAPGKLAPLSGKDNAYLKVWEAEKHRKK